MSEDSKVIDDYHLNLFYNGQKYDIFFFLEDNRKRITYKVTPSKQIHITCPIGIKQERFGSLIEKKKKWIVKQLDFFEEMIMQPVTRQYISGETYLYLGRQYRLKVIEGEKSSIKLIGQFLVIEMRNVHDLELAEKLMNRWYKDHAIEYIQRRIEIHSKYFEERYPCKIEYRYRYLRKSWGKCSQKGVIVFNVDLIKAPVHCIDYIIVHELCHLICWNHDRKFWGLVSRILPDWEARKKRLEKVQI